jgi:hypothetical protein
VSALFCSGFFAFGNMNPLSTLEHACLSNDVKLVRLLLDAGEPVTCDVIDASHGCERAMDEFPTALLVLVYSRASHVVLEQVCSQKVYTDFVREELAFRKRVGALTRLPPMNDAELERFYRCELLRACAYNDVETARCLVLVHGVPVTASVLIATAKAPNTSFLRDDDSNEQTIRLIYGRASRATLEEAGAKHGRCSQLVGFELARRQREALALVLLHPKHASLNVDVVRLILDALARQQRNDWYLWTPTTVQADLPRARWWFFNLLCV